MDNPHIPKKLQEFYDEQDIDRKITVAQWLIETGRENEDINNFYNSLLYRNDEFTWYAIGHLEAYHPIISTKDFARLEALIPKAEEYWKSTLIQLLLKVNPNRGIIYLIEEIETEKDDVSLADRIHRLGRYAEYIPANLRQQVLEKIVYEAVNGIGHAREDALSTLGCLKSKEYYYILLEALQNENPDIRWWAVQGVRRTDNQELIEQLPKMLGDPDRDVREYVQEILDELKN
jgi:HEAT repeats